MNIAIIVAVLLVLLVIFAIVAVPLAFRWQVKTLFADSPAITSKFVIFNDLAELPEPVQRYFKRVLNDGQRYISYVRLRHDGTFKPALDKDWVDVEGEQYFTTAKPGFIWKGTTSKFTARDLYIAGKGRLTVSLFSMINIVNASGENFNEGELQRWLAESVWFPTNLLPSERIKWSPIDDNSARLSFSYKAVSFSVVVTFSENGEITRMETKRFMEENERQAWLCKMSDYAEVSGIRIPMKAEAVWNLTNGEFSYAKFNVKTIEFDKPERF